MNERERWIIYPLLFFALGAALRDKFLQRVTTDELIAKRIECDELAVRDPAKDGRIVARLTSGSPPGQAGQNADRFGVLVLFDSEGRELCGVTNNALQVRQIGCDELISKSMSVVDPVNPQRRLAVLTSTTSRTPDGQTRRVGSLALIDHEGNAIFGLENDQLRMRNIVCQGIACQGLAVMAPEDQTRVLAVLGSAMLQTSEPDAEPQRVGVLQLNDQRFVGLTGNPTEAPVDAPPPPPAPSEQEARSDEQADEPAVDSTDAAEPADEPADKGESEAEDPEAFAESEADAGA